MFLYSGVYVEGLEVKSHRSSLCIEKLQTQSVKLENQSQEAKAVWGQ